ncbi:MAG: isochorismatase family protein [Chloroflexi bacterium]|nr:isochorismatase family protein [Chloroflexota bacterium]
MALCLTGRFQNGMRWVHVPTEQQMAEFFSQRGFGLKLGSGERPGLIVIDLMNAFTDPSMLLGARLDSHIEATRTLLAAARDAQVPIFYTVVLYDEQDLRDAGIWRSNSAAR